LQKISSTRFGYCAPPPTPVRCRVGCGCRKPSQTEVAARLALRLWHRTAHAQKV